MLSEGFNLYEDKCGEMDVALALVLFNGSDLDGQ